MDSTAPCGSRGGTDRHRIPEGTTADFRLLFLNFGMSECVRMIMVVFVVSHAKDLGIYNRLHQYLKCYYFSPVSGFITCPLAMTDGAARLVEQVGPKLQWRNQIWFVESLWVESLF